MAALKKIIQLKGVTDLDDAFSELDNDGYDVLQVVNLVTRTLADGSNIYDVDLLVK